MLFAATLVNGYETTIAIEEQLGHSWSAAILHRSIALPEPGLLFPGKTELQHDGKRVPMQLDRIEPYADGSIRCADVWFRSDLPANGVRKFVLQSVKAAKTTKTDLKLERKGNVYELSNARVAVRVPAGSWQPGKELTEQRDIATALSKTLNQTTPEQGIPGPVLGIRLPSQKWTAASSVRSYEKLDLIFPDVQGLVQPVDPTEPAGRFLGYSTQVTARGALFIRLRVAYRFDGHGGYVVNVMLRADEPLVRVAEEYERSGAVVLDLNNVQPTRAFYESQRPTKTGKFVDLAGPEPGLAALFLGWDNYFKKIAPAYCFTGDPNADLIGLVSTNADWLPFPYNQAFHIRTAPDGGLTLHGNLDSGHRYWGVYVGKTTEFAENPAKQFYHWWWHRIVLSLDKVANWQLTWPGMDQLEFPHTFFDRTELPEIRRRLQAEPVIRAFVERLPRKRFTDVATRYLYSGDPAYLEFLGDPKTRYLDTLPDAFLDQSGFWDDGRLNFMQISDALLNEYVGMELLLGSNVLSTAERRLFLSRLAFVQYMLNDWLYCPPNYDFSPQKEEPYPGYVQGTPNQKICYLTALGIVGSMINNHPEYRNWMARVMADHDRVVPGSVAPSGAHVESSFYSSRDTMRFGPFWTAITRAGAAPASAEHWLARLKRVYQYLGDTLTPPEPRIGGRRVYLPFGRSSTGVVDPTFMIGAWPFGRNDPSHAARLRWCWEQQGKPAPDVMGSTGGRDMSLTLLAFTEVLAADLSQEPPLKTVRWEGMGAMFRSQVGGSFESYVLFRHDPFCWNQYEQNNGAVYFYGKGVQLLGRFGAYWQKQAGQRGMLDIPFGNRLIFQDDRKAAEWTDALGNMTEFTALGALVDFARGITREQDWQRAVLFAKDRDRNDPVYLLVRDDVMRPDAASAVHWWVMSKQVQPDGIEKPGVIPINGTDKDWIDNLGNNWRNAPKLTGQSQHFVGQCGVDLDMFIAQPANPVIVTDAAGFGPPVPYCQNRKLYEYQQLVRIEQGPGKSYLSLFVPRWPEDVKLRYTTIANGNGIKINGIRISDWLFLSDGKTEYRDDNITFSGRAGIVRDDGRDGLRLMIVDGSVSAGDVTLSAQGKAALHFDGNNRIDVVTARDTDTVDVDTGDTIKGVRTVIRREQ